MVVPNEYQLLFPRRRDGFVVKEWQSQKGGGEKGKAGFLKGGGARVCAGNGRGRGFGLPIKEGGQKEFLRAVKRPPVLS